MSIAVKVPAGRRAAIVSAGILILVGFALSGSLAAAPRTAPVPAPLELRTSGEPFAVAIDAQRGRAYVTDTQDDTLVVFDLRSGATIAAIRTGHQPNHVVIAGDRAYVSNFADSSITVIDTSTNRRLKTLAIGGLGLAVDRHTNRLYAAASTRIFVLDLATERLSATITPPAGANVWGLAIDPATSRLFVTDIASPRVLVYELSANQLVTEIALDAPARFAIASSPSGDVVVAGYLAADAQLAVIDASTATVRVRIPVGPFTNSLVVHPSSGVVYASSALDRTIRAIDTGDPRATSRLTLAQRPGGLALTETDQLIVVTTGGAVPLERPIVDTVPLVRP